MAAQETARLRKRQLLGTEDLLSALAEPNGTSSSQALERLGITVPDIHQKMKSGGWRASPAHIPMAPDTKRAIQAALQEADNRGDNDVTSTHLLLGLVADRHGEGGRIISELNLSYPAVHAALEGLADPK